MPQDTDIEIKFIELRECLAAGDADGVQDAIYGLSPVKNGWKAVPDEVVERFLALLGSEQMYESRFAGHVLNYFEFESPRLSARQKSLCLGFLSAHGDQFLDVHSIQVVAELRHKAYLK
jgi:hypothetical protein